MYTKNKWLIGLFLAALLLSGCDYGALKKQDDAQGQTTQEQPAAEQSGNEQATSEQAEPEQAAPEEPEPEQPGSSIEMEVALTTTDGETINVQGTETGLIFEGYEDKVIFIEVFAWWCPDCKATISILNDMLAEYGDKLMIIALENDGISNDEIRTYANTNGVEFKTVAKGNTGALIPYAKNKGGWRGEVPYLVVVDDNTNIYTSMSGTGEITYSNLERILKDLIN